MPKKRAAGFQIGLVFGGFDKNSDQRRRSEEFKAQGLCTDGCGRPLKTTWYCAECAARRAAVIVSNKRSLVASGMCAKNCGRKHLGGWYCAECMITKRRSSMLERYGLTVNNYIAMHRLQDGRCAICHRKETKECLAVDHCHDTGEVRALLCRPCNTAIGLFREDPDTIKRAERYIASYLRVKRRIA